MFDDSMDRDNTYTTSYHRWGWRSRCCCLEFCPPLPPPPLHPLQALELCDEASEFARGTEFPRPSIDSDNDLGLFACFFLISTNLSTAVRNAKSTFAAVLAEVATNIAPIFSAIARPSTSLTSISLTRSCLFPIKIFRVDGPHSWCSRICFNHWSICSNDSRRVAS